MRQRHTIGWFSGFKLNLIMNGEGGLFAVKVTAGNVDDRRPMLDNLIYGLLLYCKVQATR
ncbi:hypothetical protein DXX93_19655 [Thalassotalea euphylliae]|uniref:Transposase DDE domain-containing protein n=1 Tax=Thalassotalea euphylliae TaxID=1655234 RepID=A0A3E0TXE1_9GAMM|nr:hypothetical protein DXX93_19655 [Thalassotalea euphylliae]